MLLPWHFRLRLRFTVTISVSCQPSATDSHKDDILFSAPLGYNFTMEYNTKRAFLPSFSTVTSSYSILLPTSSFTVLSIFFLPSTVTTSKPPPQIRTRMHHCRLLPTFCSATLTLPSFFFSAYLHRCPLHLSTENPSHLCHLTMSTLLFSLLPLERQRCYLSHLHL